MESKVENKKLTIQILHERLLNQANGSVLLKTCENLPRNGDITVTTLCTKLTCRHAVDRIGTLWLHSTWQQLLYSCSKYFGAKRCFLLNDARCKISQKLRLFAILPTAMCPSHANKICARAYLHMHRQGFPAL